MEEEDAQQRVDIPDLEEVMGGAVSVARKKRVRRNQLPNNPTSPVNIDTVRNLDDCGVDGCHSCERLRRSLQNHLLRHFLYDREPNRSRTLREPKTSQISTQSSGDSVRIPTRTISRPSTAALRESPSATLFKGTDLWSPDGRREPSSTTWGR